MIERRIELRAPLDLAATLGPLAHGRGDATTLLGQGEAWLAFRTPSGAAALRLALDRSTVLRALAWGDGASEALDATPALVGELDRPEALVAHHPIIRQLQRTHPGLRLPRSGRVLHALVPSILEQKVTGTEAWRAWRALIRHYGEAAPGPAEHRLRLPPTPERLAGLASWAWHPLGVERRRAETVIRACRVAARLEGLSEVAPSDAYPVLRALPGVGPWTAAEVGLRAFGDPDAVSVGDFHLPHLVSWALAGEPRGTDERMLELLAPYAGQRARVIRLLEASGIRAPRYGPRLSPRSIAAI